MATHNSATTDLLDLLRKVGNDIDDRNGPEGDDDSSFHVFSERLRQNTPLSLKVDSRIWLIGGVLWVHRNQGVAHCCLLAGHGVANPRAITASKHIK
jgi:hypothetical protein